MLTSDNEGSTDEPASAALAISRVFIYSVVSVSYCAARHRPPEGESDTREEGGRGGEGSPLSFFKGTREPARSRVFFFFSSFFLSRDKFFDCFVYFEGINKLLDSVNRK